MENGESIFTDSVENKDRETERASLGEMMREGALNRSRGESEGKTAYLEDAHRKGAEAFIAVHPNEEKEGFNISLIAEDIPEDEAAMKEKLRIEDAEGRPKTVPRGEFVYSPPKPEFVSLDKIVGGPYRTDPPTWFVDKLGEERENRGAPRIWKLVQKFKEGAKYDPYSPIRVEKYGDEYYISDDGRHRIAALKAMGVKELPMLVIEATPKS